MDHRPPTREPRHANTRLWRGFIVVLALSVLAETLTSLHPHFEIESVFGFSAWIGLAAGAALVAAAQALAHLLSRPDTYYGGSDD